MKGKDLIGLRFGRLTVVEKVGKTKNRDTLWRCKCICGKETVHKGTHLKSGRSQSCGCLRIELRTTHGGADTRLYRIWRNMKQRCRNPNSTSYKHYGALGVGVCVEWENFGGFQKWAIENGYKDDLTIDRIDPEGNYEPINCRWATYAEQQHNKRKDKKGVMP